MEIDICLDGRLASGELKELGLLAESYGIRAVWNTCVMAARDPFSNLAELASASSTLRVGLMALSPYEMHPFRIAMNLLTLNELAWGRAEIALGSGADVLQPAGLRADHPVQHVRECLEIVVGATRRRPVNYEGQHYTLKGYDATWATAPPPAVHACAMLPRMLRMATGVADGVMYSDFTPGLARDTVARTRRSRREQGLGDAPFAINSFQPLFLHADAAVARRRALTTIADRALFRRYITEGFLTDDEHTLVLEHMPELYAMPASGATSVRGVPQHVLDRCVDHLTLVGSTHDPAVIVQRICEFRNAGMTRLALGIDENPAAVIEVVGNVVIPAVRGPGADPMRTNVGTVVR